MAKKKYVHTDFQHNTKAANEVVPSLINLLNPKSVIDVGCGTGTWLYVFKQHGVKEVLGVEGNHLNKNLLMISEEELITANLEMPIKINKRFDLCISLEVAEHLKESSADIFVQSLTNLSDTIIFSAALVNQGGQNHINEQWPQYWQQKFSKHGYEFYDVFRTVFWQNTNIHYWYKQNMFLVAKKGILPSYTSNNSIINYIHPELFIEKTETLYNLQRGKAKFSQYIKLLIKFFLVKLRLKKF
jgi:hypothetical protein